MKRLALSVLLSIFVTGIFAQYDDQAYQILESMSTKYQGIPAFSAKIVYSMVNESEGINENFQGTIVIKGQKYRLEMDEQVIINDGETVWTYLPDVNEVSIDIYDPDNGDINPSRIYEAYKEGFKYLYLNDTDEDGQTYQVVDLVPEDAKNSQFFKIRLEINKKSSLLKSWTMFDKGGNKYIYHIKDLNTQLNPPDTYFAFKESDYDGVEVIDLR